MYLQLSESLPAWNSDQGTGDFPEWFADDSIFKVDFAWPNNVLNQEYVAYLFAEDTPGLIKCGSFTTNASGTSETVTTGFRTQWLMYKRIDDAGGAWETYDVKRNDFTSELRLNTTNGDLNGRDPKTITDTTFTVNGTDTNSTFVYIAIAEPPAARSMTTEELEAQKLQFLTYENRKMVNCGQQAQAARDNLRTALLAAGYTEPEIAAAYVNPDPVAIAINGYYPLYRKESDANGQGNGTSHVHTFDGVTYYMPNGVTMYHGTYVDNSGSGGGGGGY